LTRRIVLIVHPGTLGDVLLARPAIRVVKKAYASHAIGLMAGDEIATLLRTCAEVEHSFSLESGGLAGLLAGPESVKESLRQWLSRCDLAVCWMSDPDGGTARTLRELGVRDVIVRSPNSAACRAVHQSDRVLETVQDVVAISGPDAEMSLNLPRQVWQAGEKLLSSLGGKHHPMVLVHPGSGSPHKCSEPTLLARTIDRLQSDGLVPLMIGGPADDERIRLTAGLCARPPLILHHLDLLSVAGVLAHVSLFIGHDSGLTHLAAALGRPTVALFGPTDAGRWGPIGSHVTVLRGDSCRCDRWEEVQACREKPCLRIEIHDLIQTYYRRLGQRQDSVA
jgi:heptosyltransferase-3